MGDGSALLTIGLAGIDMVDRTARLPPRRNTANMVTTAQGGPWQHAAVHLGKFCRCPKNKIPPQPPNWP